MRLWLLPALALLAAGPAQARDERLLHDLNAALATPAAKDKLDDTVQFVWGDTPFAEPLESFEVHTASRKVNSFVRGDQEGCDTAFLQAVVALRDRAKELGANAVVGIKSMYGNREFRSETQYECRAGYFVAIVTLEGRLVRLPGPGPRTIRP